MNAKTLILAAAALLVFAPAASAQPVNMTAEGVSAGLTPASPLYFVENFVESLEVRLASAIGGPDLKAKALANNADERLAEARALAERNNSEKASELVNEYERTMNRSYQAASERNDSRLRQQLENVSQKNTEVLRDVKDRVPEPAKDAIQGAIDRSNRNPPGGMNRAPNRPEAPVEPRDGVNVTPGKNVSGKLNETGSRNLGDNVSPPERPNASGKGAGEAAEDLTEAPETDRNATGTGEGTPEEPEDTDPDSPVTRSGEDSSDRSGSTDSENPGDSVPGSPGL